MAARLTPAYLRDIALREGGFHWPMDQRLDALERLTPVRGNITARHLGSALEVHAGVETIVTLMCNRCLRTFNLNLSFHGSELIAIDSPGARATDPAGRTAPTIEVDDLMERIASDKRFAPAQWLFEQLHPQLPVVNRGGSHCPGPPQSPRTAEVRTIDPRRQALAVLHPRTTANRDRGLLGETDDDGR